MSDRNGLTALLTDRQVKTKIALGFACVLAILIVNATLAYVGFNASADGFATYAHRVTVVGIAQEINRSFLEIRRNLREYSTTAAEANATLVRTESEQLRALLRQGLAEITDPGRHARIEEMSTLVDAYLKAFDQVSASMPALAKQKTIDLPATGTAAARTLAELLADAGKVDNSDIVALGNQVDRLLLVGRLDSARQTGHLGSDGKVADVAFAQAADILTGIAAMTEGTALAEKCQTVQAALANYRKTRAESLALQAKITALVDGDMRTNGDQVQRDAEAIRDSGIADETSTERATIATLVNTRWLVVEFSVGGVLLGAGLAWLIGRGISGPVVRLCATMSRLAAGDKSIEISGLERGDEIGAMAKAVDVFKRNMLEVDRLRDEQESQKHEARVERRAALRRLADGFEGQVGGVIQAVGSATSQLQAASNHMRDNAARTSTEAASVASASDESAANAQAVASASEELTASINEIAQQVENARVIAARADVEANETTELVRKLSETVNAIGAIVALINDVASQTNLLALNATIEAARAGEAGRGFAVVASEVKNLANQTAKATEEIASKIGAVQSGTEDAARAIASITRVMSQMSTISATIAAAVEEQSSATAEIARNVEQSAAGTREVSTRIAKVNVAARETGDTAIGITESATELAGQAQTLRTEVTRFLEQVRSDQETERMAS